MWDVVLVAEQQLQRMVARRQCNLDFGLASTEMQMVRIIRDWLIEWWKLGIDQQMMMAGIGAVRAGRGDAHVLQTKINRQLGGNRVPILEADEIDIGSRRGRSQGGTLLCLGHCASRDCNK